MPREMPVQLEPHGAHAVADEVLCDATRELELTPDERVADIPERKSHEQPHVCLLVE